MERAFADAAVEGYENLIPSFVNLPDPDDAHVVAAALKTRASIIVTENIKDFPNKILMPINIEAKTSDEFLADTIDLDHGRAIPAIKKMRDRFKNPEKTAEALLLDMEAAGLIQTVDALRGHILSL